MQHDCTDPSDLNRSHETSLSPKARLLGGQSLIFQFQWPMGLGSALPFRLTPEVQIGHKVFPDDVGNPAEPF